MTTAEIENYMTMAVGRKNARYMVQNCIDWTATISACMDALNETETIDAEYDLRKPRFIDWEEVETAFLAIAQ